MRKKNMKKKLLPLAVLSAVTIGSLGGAFTTAEAKGPSDNNAKIKNVIFLIGDGMGVSYTSAYRYLQDSPDSKFVDRTVLDQYLVGQQMTYPEDPEENITDSASAATAMSAGIKTYNNAIAVDNDGSDVKLSWRLRKNKAKQQDLSRLQK